MAEIRALSAMGMLGSGFREDTLERAMALEPDFMGADSGSTDPGPHHLRSGGAQFSDSACKRDPRLMLLAARHAGIFVLAGSAAAGATTTSSIDSPRAPGTSPYMEPTNE